MEALLKLAGVAVLSAAAMLFLPNVPSLNRPAMPGGVPPALQTFTAIMMIFGIVMAIAGTAVNFGLFYLSARMQLVFFEATVTRQTKIAPLWRKYRSRTWRWIGVKIVPSAIIILPFIVLMLSFSRGMAARMQSIQQGQPGHPPSLHFFMQFFAFFAAIMLFGAVGGLTGSLLTDFAMPSIALEDASIGTAWKRFAEVFSNDPGGTFFYVFLKIVLFIAVMLAQYLVILIAILIPGVIFFAGGWGLHAVLRHAGIAGSIVLFLAATLAILVALAYFLYIMILIAGTMFTFFQAYAIYFLGGRYQPLGDVLEPPPAYAAPPAIEPPPPMEPPIPKPAV